MAAWGRGRCGWAWWGGRGAAHDPARAREVPRHVGAVRSSRRLGVCSVRGQRPRGDDDAGRRGGSIVVVVRGRRRG